ncbi:translocation protein TolB [Stieleria neptunia]|uniref:Translocation protein TolB n=1 Tax=Stieleria neptunia TaxID=2527979 RepID=A0A518HNR3_9BACT|nr:TIR domain-containing protein [Stieleria neptunia]QDV42484.1 translocation protein TolB [Stieleria neptunia]
MSTESDFEWDAFLSHSSNNKVAVRDLANRLKSDGVRVWFDEWEIRPGDSIPAKIENGLEHSRVLVLCMSAEAFGSDWAQLESHTYRFKDPLNQSRRFIPVRLDDADIKGSLSQLSYIDWRNQRETEYPKLLKALASRSLSAATEPPATHAQRSPHDVSVGEFVASGLVLRHICKHDEEVGRIAWSPNGRYVAAPSKDGRVKIWDVQQGTQFRTITAHREPAMSLDWSPDGKRIAVGSIDSTASVWTLKSTRASRRLRGHKKWVNDVAWSPCGRFIATASQDSTIGIWNAKDGRHLHWFEDHERPVNCLAWFKAKEDLWLVSASDDRTLRLWNMREQRCVKVLRGHDDMVYSLAVSPCVGPQLASGSLDTTLHIWDLAEPRKNRILEGHTGAVVSLSYSPDGRLMASKSYDGRVLVWRTDTWRTVAEISESTQEDMFDVPGISFSPDGKGLATLGLKERAVRIWEVQSEALLANPGHDIGTQYTNAKVILVGDSHAGKTGLSNRLALDTFRETDSTVGAWSTQWKQPLPDGDEETAATMRRIDEDGLGQDPTAMNVKREVWLWDFGGQADQRLIHQLYMDQTQVAALVFDPQKDDVFETLGQWDRDLSRVDKGKPEHDKMTKLLVAGRCDAGGLRVARSQVDSFVKERGYAGYYPTSAKEDEGCKELKQAIIDGISWDNIPWRSSPVLFKRLKDEIIHLKDEGRVLLRFKEFREVLTLRMQGEDTRFTDAELKAVVGLLAGPGVVWELAFGSWVLLQPERINAYAQAVIQTVREDEFDRGCISEKRVLDGDLTYHSSAERLPKDEEQFVLLAMHQILVERGLCIRHQAESGQMLLMFPSYYRRERQEPSLTPAVQVSYTFNGFLDEIYATLVVKLHHTREFTHDNLWRNAANFKTQAGEKSLGLRLIRKPEGQGELQAFFAEDMPVAEKIIFSKYIHEHLLQSGNDVRRFRHYVCLNDYRGNPCGTTANRDVAMERLEECGESAELQCQRCGATLCLWDELEERFADDDIRQRVQDLRDAVKIKLDAESKERVLVGEVISTVALAGQICREIQVSDWGLDAEVEFKNDDGQASAKRVWLQLKSGESFLTTRKKDGQAIFKSFNQRQAKYWMEHAEPVMLLIRNSSGEIQWVDIREELRRITNNGEKQVSQIVFDGKRFDVMSVRRWRDVALNS